MGSFDLYRPQMRQYTILIHSNMLYATFIPTIVYLDLPPEAPGGPNRPQRLYVTAKHGSKLLLWSQNRVGGAQNSFTASAKVVGCFRNKFGVLSPSRKWFAFRNMPKHTILSQNHVFGTSREWFITWFITSSLFQPLHSIHRGVGTSQEQVWAINSP